MEYKNPIIRGFYPDPSVCRANGKYYLVCSTMHFFPSIPVFESEDLINWNQIGWCLTRKSQINLEGVPSSGGIFAPTIRFYRGRFYVVTTDDSRHRNFYVYTDNIYGEWSEPVEVKQGGIDPSLFFEEEKVYFTSNGRDKDNIPCIYQCEIDIDSGEKLTESRIIWKGSGGRLIEGPHLYKIGDYYYLLAAEGGTEYGHMVTYARASSPYGPFIGYKNNPVLTNRNLGDDEIQGIGHGDLLQDWDGSWWMIHLGFRQIALWRQYHNLGREVFLMPVRWNKDGWFTIGNRGITEKNVNVSWIEKEVEQRQYNTIDFSHEDWNKQWSFIRNPEKERYQFAANYLKLCGSTISLNEPGTPTFVGIRQQEFACILEVDIEILSGEAGVSIYMDEKHHYDIAARLQGGKLEYISRICIGGIIEEINAYGTGDRKTVRIEIRSSRDKYILQIKENNRVCLEKEMESKYLSSEVAGGFTGVLFGLYAYNEDDDKQWCEFKNFRLQWLDK